MHIVDKNEIENAVCLQQLTTQILQILSPTIAGVLVSVLSYRNIYLTDMGVVLIVTEYEIDKILVGVLFAASPLGGVIGSLLAKRIGLQKFQVYHSMIFVSLMGGFNVVMGIFAYYHQIGCFIAAYFISGIFFGLSNTQFGIFYKKYISREVQGRFFGFLNSILLMATPAGNLINVFFH